MTSAELRAAGYLHVRRLDAIALVGKRVHVYAPTHRLHGHEVVVNGLHTTKPDTWRTSAGLLKWDSPELRVKTLVDGGLKLTDFGLHVSRELGTETAALAQVLAQRKPEDPRDIDDAVLAELSPDRAAELRAAIAQRKASP